PCGPAYAAFPYTEDFESWQELCAITTVPGPNWWNAPFSGHASWRRNDQPPSSGYAPPASLGSFSARSQASQAGNGDVGDLDLHIDMSTASGPSELRFDHISGGSFVQLREALLVYVSEDGGVNFTMVGDTITWSGPSFWTPALRPIASTSATTVIRLRARR